MTAKARGLPASPWHCLLWAKTPSNGLNVVRGGLAMFSAKLHALAQDTVTVTETVAPPVPVETAKQPANGWMCKT